MVATLGGHTWEALSDIGITETLIIAMTGFTTKPLAMDQPSTSNNFFPYITTFGAS
jgi:hypothetical protein